LIPYCISGRPWLFSAAPHTSASSGTAAAAKYSALLWQPLEFIRGNHRFNTSDNADMKDLGGADANQGIRAAAVTALDSHMLWVGPAASNGQWDVPPDGSLLRLMIKQTSLKKNKVEEFQRQMSRQGLYCPRVVGSNKIYHRDKRRRSEQKSAAGSGTMEEYSDLLSRQHRTSIFETPFIGNNINNSKGHSRARAHYAVQESDSLKHRYYCNSSSCIQCQYWISNVVHTGSTIGVYTINMT
jgi:hypothetical protein